MFHTAQKQRGIVHLLLLIVLLIGIAAAVYLVQFRQILNPDASSEVLSLATTSPQWKIVQDDGYFLTIENSLLKIKFAYGGLSPNTLAATDNRGWFEGNKVSGCNYTARLVSGSGGGGCDGSIVELYYKPTDPTTSRNLIQRNKNYGSGYDALDLWEAESKVLTAEEVAENLRLKPRRPDGTLRTERDVRREEFNAPDWKSHIHGVPQTLASSGKKVNYYEDAGRLFVDFDVNFKSWNIKKTYIVYPTGKITVTADIKVIQPAKHLYLAHRMNLAGSKYSFINKRGTFTTSDDTTVNWGTNYQADAENLVAVSDGINRNTGAVSRQPALRELQIRENKQENTYSHSSPYYDSYTGYLLNSNNSNDPDILIMNSDKSDYDGPFQKISKKVAQHSLSEDRTYNSYIESAIFNHDWMPSNLNGVGMTWFYFTSSGYQNPGYWDTSVGSWNETFHIYVAPGTSYASASYIDQWKEAAGQIQAPFNIVGAQASLNPKDKLHHLTATTGAKQVKFQWKRPSTASASLNYQTSFVIKGLAAVPDVDVVNDSTGNRETGVATYYSPLNDSTLVTLNFAQPASVNTYTITVTNPILYQTSPTPVASPVASPTPSPVVSPVPGGTDTTLPSVTLTSPSNESIVKRWTRIIVTATASDNVGIARVEFYDDATLIPSGEDGCVDTTAPYECNWWIGGEDGDIHQISAKAFDTAGNSQTSTVSVTAIRDLGTASPIPNPTDTTAPSVSITSPANESNVQRRQTLTIAANITDNVAVTKVEFLVNGNVICTENGAPYTCYWRVTGKNGTSHSILVKAYDAVGNMSSQTVKVNVR